MAKLAHNLQDKIDLINEGIESDSDLILEQFDFDEFWKNPRVYLEQLSNDFLEQHIDEIQDGATAGAKFATDVLKRS